MITFEQLPEAVTRLESKVNSIYQLLEKNPTKPIQEDCWYDVDGLRDYLPGEPSRAAIYAKVSQRKIPHKKEGKRLIFRKSEIDLWLKSKGRETIEEIESQVAEGFNKRRK